MQGSYVLATNSTNGLEIYLFDREQERFTLVTTFHYPFNQEYRAVDISGAHAYVSCKYGIEVIDIRGIESPGHVIYIPKGSLNKDVVTKGAMAFLAGAFQDIHIFDLSDYFISGGNIRTYTLAYNSSYTMNSYDVAVDGELLYCSNYYNGLEVFNWYRFIGGLYDIDIQSPYFGMPYYEVFGNKDGSFQSVPYGNLVRYVSMQFTANGYPSSVFRIDEIALSLAEGMRPQHITHYPLSPRKS